MSSGSGLQSCRICVKRHYIEDIEPGEQQLFCLGALGTPGSLQYLGMALGTEDDFLLGALRKPLGAKIFQT